MKQKKKSQNCRRKLKLDSYDAEYQADSENVLYVNIFMIDIMTSSNFGLKIAKRNQNCRRKLKLVSNDTKFQANSENK